jgi:DNA-binding transcriptional ArsR family regulator
MDPLTTTFSALADPTRRAILARLAQGETHVGELTKPFKISGPAISRHLRVLEDAGLIEREVNAQWRVCRLRGPALQAARDWLDQYREFWEASLDRLADLLESKPPAAAKRGTRRNAPPIPPRRRRPAK